MKRRDWIHGALLTGTLAAISGCGGTRARYRLFHEAEAGTLHALLQQLIPDDEIPGAPGANVMRFLDRQLARAYSGHLAAYRKGLEALNQSALLRHQAPFANLAFEQQELLVEGLEAGSLPPEPWGDLSQREFFRTVRTHTMQGYYGDPRHGGNVDAVSWRALGVPHPPVRGRDDYQFPKEPSKATAAAERTGP
ncbi:MAG: gluconate 2-dehydrogenase subunit 3 family protein [Bryobacterales bacterium]|jgi:gluconate 2-dehydrogenase gamma chain|nr:gluconate 2-dehydrogenase subunit 3 family protein [Bryobacterales bacterium]